MSCFHARALSIIHALVRGPCGMSCFHARWHEFLIVSSMFAPCLFSTPLFRCAAAWVAPMRGGMHCFLARVLSIFPTLVLLSCGMSCFHARWHELLPCSCPVYHPHSFLVSQGMGCLHARWHELLPCSLLVYFPCPCSGVLLHELLPCIGCFDARDQSIVHTFVAVSCGMSCFHARMA